MSIESVILRFDAHSIAKTPRFDQESMKKALLHGEFILAEEDPFYEATVSYNQ